MTKQLKRTLVASSVALALGLPVSAYAAQGVNFDPDGTGGAGSYVVKAFDWDSGHVLYSGCFGNAGLGAASGCTIYAQGSISALKAPNDTNLAIPAGVTYTFTLQKQAVMSDLGGSYDGKAGVGAKGFLGVSNNAADLGIFTIYADSTPSAGDPNALAGTGYNDGSIILTGSVSIVSYAIANTGVTPVLLDQSGSDDWAGLTTLNTSGSPSFNIEVLTKDDAYFTDALAMFLVSFTPDANQSENSLSPFTQINPSASVAGKAFSAADVGVDGVDDIFCGGASGDGPCSGEFQGDAKTTFVTQVVPEPGMLALIGLGLGVLGVSARRRRLKV